MAWLQPGWSYDFWDGWYIQTLVVQRLYNYDWYNCNRCLRRIRHGQLYGCETGTRVEDDKGNFGINDYRNYPENRYCIQCSGTMADINTASQYDYW